MRASKKFGFETARVPRKPLRSAAELAEEFGVPHRTLVGLMNTDPNGPRPELRNRSVACQASWYKPDVVRAWWAKRQAATGQATGATA